MKDSSGNEASHGTDSTCTAALMVTGLHHIAVVIDNGPFLMYFIVDGLVCDGGRDAAVGFKWITNSVKENYVKVEFFNFCFRSFLTSTVLPNCLLHQTTLVSFVLATYTTLLF